MESTMPGMWAKTRTTLEMIKWEHSIFALPFALTAVLLAAHGLPAWRTVVFVVASGQLNRLTLYLSPVVLAVLLGYSYMKRITRWSHLVLGLALGLAPTAAWIAVRGSLDARILVLTAAVTLWAGGFDVLYACQDFEHDRSVGLHSLPQSVGLTSAFWAARAMHLAMLGLLLAFGWLFQFRALGWLGIAAVGLLLTYEHSLVSPRDLRRLNAAFFTMNGVIAIVFLAFVAADLWLRS
jgi:4-hydroxybenzoate polyprenyltransferase